MTKYGLFGKLQAQAGRGSELAEILLKAASLMENAAGCSLYIVNKGADSPDSIWVMEVWGSKEAHDDSFKLPGVRELIEQAVPILAEITKDGLTLDVLGKKGGALIVDEMFVFVDGIMGGSKSKAVTKTYNTRRQLEAFTICEWER